MNPYGTSWAPTHPKTWNAAAESLTMASRSQTFSRANVKCSLGLGQELGTYLRCASAVGMKVVQLVEEQKSRFWIPSSNSNHQEEQVITMARMCGRGRQQPYSCQYWATQSPQTQNKPLSSKKEKVLTPLAFNFNCTSLWRALLSSKTLFQHLSHYILHLSH